MSDPNTQASGPFVGQSSIRVVLVLAAIATVFVASYAFASAQSESLEDYASAAGYSVGAATAPASDASGGGGGGSACACCGDSGPEVEGSTTVEGDVQSVDVAIDLGYNPNVVRAKAGIPIEITFARGDGCYAEIVFPDFGVYEDLTQGPVTITLPALEAGTYGWSCGMQMAYGAIIVE